MTLFLLQIVSKLPFWLLYAISNVLAPLLSRLYRRKLVLANIEKVFPEKATTECHRIADKFYRNLLDLAFETVKLTSMSANEVRARVSLVDNDALKEIRSSEVPILIYTTHVSNWEYMSALSQLEVGHGIPIYKPLKNKKIDRWVFDMRSRFGATPQPKSEMINVVRHLKGRSLLGILADQTPGKYEKGKVWAEFFGVQTAFFKGVVALANLTNAPCYFAAIHRVGRGKYSVEFIKIGDPPYQRKDTEVFRRYLELSEDQIRKYPDEWLWSHNRWKYKRQDNEEIIKFS